MATLRAQGRVGLGPVSVLRTPPLFAATPFLFLLLSFPSPEVGFQHG